MTLSRQFQACLFFYLRKDFARIKTLSSKQLTKKKKKKKLKRTLNDRSNNFLRAQTSKWVRVACFAFWWFLRAQNPFVKKNKQA